MLISTGNEQDFHFGVRHGSTHAKLEIKAAFVIPVVQNIIFLVLLLRCKKYKHTGYRLKLVHSKFKKSVNCREPDRLFSCQSRILR